VPRYDLVVIAVTYNIHTLERVISRDQ
jgi:hypothetical protein